MNKAVLIFITFLTLAVVNGCSKRTNPATTATEPAKPSKKATVKTAVPKVIVVNDKVAKRSVDGRYYYDLEGRRYWRNNRDGKYYLFHKSMFDNPDFKSPGN